MPLFWLSLAFLIGLWLGEWSGLARSAWTANLGITIGLGITARLVRRIAWMPRVVGWIAARHPALFLPPVLLPAALCGGGLVYQLWQPAVTPEFIAFYNDQGPFRIQGTLALPPDRREKVVLLRIEVESIRPTTPNAASTGIHGGLQVMLPVSTPPLQYGDRVALVGKLINPPEEADFSYRAYLARQGVYSYLAYPRLDVLGSSRGNPVMAGLYALQARLYAVIQRQFPPPESELLAGILLGIEQGIPEELMESFRATGTAHIIAISGFNITILVTFVSTLLLRSLRRRWLAIILSLITVGAYTLLVGASPSVVRAAVMGGLAVIGAEIGRRSASLNALAFTAALMCAFSPGLLHDPSFQLSAAATLGLVLYSRPLQEAFSALAARRLPAGIARRVTGLVSEYLLTTLAAQITTLPVIAFHFQRFSLSALLANPLVLPPQPLVMALGGMAALVGLVLPPLGQLIAWLAQPFTTYTIRMVELLAQLPGGEMNLDAVHPAWVAAYYAVLLALTVKRSFPGKIGGFLRQQLTPSLVLLGGFALAAAAWQAVLALPDGRLHLTVLNVPDGPALLVKTPDGRALLINSGSRARSLLNELGRRQPLPGPGLDWILISDRRASALAAFEVILPRYPPRQAALNAQPASSRTRERLVEVLQQKGTGLHNLEPGLKLDLGDGARLEVLAASKLGAALLVEYGSFRALLPGGVVPADLPAFPLSSNQSLSLLVLGEADREHLADPLWARLAPQAGVVCSPPPGFQPNLPVVALPPGGWMDAISDGQQMWLEMK